MAESEKIVFGTEEEGTAFCGGQEDGHTWISWQLANGQWTAAATNLPKAGGPTGQAIEAKANPPEPADPSIGRPGGPPIWAGG